MKLNIYAILVVCLSLFAACSKDDKKNNTGSNNSGNGPIVVNINGERWVAGTAYTSTFQPFGLNLIGVNGQDQLTLTMSPYNGVQTYQLDGSNKVTFIEDGIQYNSLEGQIIVSSVTDDAISGTFNCVLISTVSSVRLDFTNGSFTVPR
jgi:hypothetical protein